MVVDTQNPAYRHGHAPKAGFSPEYHSWTCMIQRCTNPKRAHWLRYGGRGIKVCDRWRKFENFLADMGPRPAGTTLERKDNDGNYTPENCEWAGASRQARNSSQTTLIDIGGVKKGLPDWCDEFKININTVRCRVRKHGWSYLAAITTPLQDHSRHGPKGRLLPAASTESLGRVK